MHSSQVVELPKKKKKKVVRKAFFRCLSTRYQPVVSCHRQVPIYCFFVCSKMILNHTHHVLARVVHRHNVRAAFFPEIKN